MWQQHQQQKTPLCNSNQRQFSFDWHKGLSSSSLRDATKGKQSVPFLSSFNYGDGFTFTSRQRWRPFISLLLLSALMFVLAGLFLPLVLLRPHKFCLFFTMGSMLSMASFAVLRGPLEQCKHMFSMARCARARLPMCTQRRRRSQQQQKQRQQQQRQRQQQQHSSSRACSSSGPSSPAAQPCSAALQRSSAAQQRSSTAAQLPSSPAATRRGRLRANGLAVCFCRLSLTRALPPCPRRLPFTSTYLGSMLLTLYAALVLQSYLLVILFSMLQACAVLWYMLSYIPGGAPVLRVMTRGGLKAASALCCRGWASNSGSGLLPL